jgi:hypothetical protein
LPPAVSQLSLTTVSSSRLSASPLTVNSRHDPVGHARGLQRPDPAVDLRSRSRPGQLLPADHDGAARRPAGTLICHPIVLVPLLYTVDPSRTPLSPTSLRRQLADVLTITISNRVFLDDEKLRDFEQ